MRFHPILLGCINSLWKNEGPFLRNFGSWACLQYFYVSYISLTKTFLRHWRYRNINMLMNNIFLNVTSVLRKESKVGHPSIIPAKLHTNIYSLERWRQTLKIPFIMAVKIDALIFSYFSSDSSSKSVENQHHSSLYRALCDKLGMNGTLDSSFRILFAALLTTSVRLLAQWETFDIFMP